MDDQSKITQKPRFGFLTYALLLGALSVFVVAWQTSLPPVISGDSLAWTRAPEKEKAARALNATVRLKDFKASVIKIEAGDNFWQIARRQKINIDTILGLNPDFEDLGAKLNRAVLVATQKGAMHQLKAGESLASVADAYGVSLSAVKEANKSGFFGVREGQLLFIPGAKPRQLKGKVAELFHRRSLLRSPLAGRYSSLMGTREDPFTGSVSHHNGVDIKTGFNELVGASAAGKVIMAGWNGGYGKCVKIDHGNGYVTLYGHLNSIGVRLGQQVRQHQIIGRVGTTGRATGPHLHFTVYYQGKVKNPLEFLW